MSWHVVVSLLWRIDILPSQGVWAECPLKIINVVLLVLIQRWRLEKPNRWNSSEEMTVSNEGLDVYRLVSAAYKWTRELAVWFIEIWNKVSPKMDPWGTPRLPGYPMVLFVPCYCVLLSSSSSGRALHSLLCRWCHRADRSFDWQSVFDSRSSCHEPKWLLLYG